MVEHTPPTDHTPLRVRHVTYMLRRLYVQYVRVRVVRTKWLDDTLLLYCDKQLKLVVTGVLQAVSKINELILPCMASRHGMKPSCSGTLQWTAPPTSTSAYHMGTYSQLNICTQLVVETGWVQPTWIELGTWLTANTTDAYQSWILIHWILNTDTDTLIHIWYTGYWTSTRLSNSKQLLSQDSDRFAGLNRGIVFQVNGHDFMLQCMVCTHLWIGNNFVLVLNGFFNSYNSYTTGVDYNETTS